MNGRFAWLANRIKPHWVMLTSAFLLTLTAAGVSLLDPLIIRWLIDRILPERRIDLLGRAVVMLAAVLIVRLVATRSANLLVFRAAQKTVFQLKCELFRHAQSLSADFHDKTQTGDLVFKIESDVAEISNLGDCVLSTLRTLLFTIFILVAMILLSMPLTFAVLPMFPLFLLVRRGLGHRVSGAVADNQRIANRLSTFLYENLSGVVQIQILLQEAAQERQFRRLASDAQRAQNRRKLLELTLNVLSLSVIMLAAVLIFAVGGYQVIEGALTIGGMVAFNTYMSKLFDSFSDAVDIHTQVRRTMTSVGRLLDLLKELPTINDRADAQSLCSATTPALEFRHVSFGYANQQRVLVDVSFHIQPGERVAIVGRSGCGKSTVAKIATRLYDYGGGAVLVDGREIRNLTVASVRRAVSLVPQHPFLFFGSIRDNLLIGNPDATEEELEEVIRIAQLRSVIDSQPRGLDEPVGEAGASFSGGERQRLALARTLLQRPSVLILDECTSAIDGDTEAAILRALAEHFRSRTLIVIAHRMSTIAWAQRVLVLADGELVQEGAPDILKAVPGVYAQMHAALTAGH